MTYKITNEKEIVERKFSDIVELTKEGIVLTGCGGDLDQWRHGVSGQLVEDDIVSVDGVHQFDDDGGAIFEFGDLFSEAFFTVTVKEADKPDSGGRTDLVMVFSEHTKLDMGKMAMWRIRYGECSWVSDFKVNYANQYGVEVVEEFDDDDQGDCSGREF